MFNMCLVTCVFSVSKSGPVHFFAVFGQTGTGTGSHYAQKIANQHRTAGSQFRLVLNRLPTGLNRSQLQHGSNQSQPVRTDYNHHNCHSNIYIYVICI
jgi:hypothetical protein